MLLRVPDELHARLLARARREGRSLNLVATEILESVADADVQDRTARLRARAAALGILAEPPGAARAVSLEERRRVVDSTRGLGPFIDDFLREEREAT
jgi:plasmid stability protein